MLSLYSTLNTIILGDFNYGDINWNKNTSSSLGRKFLKYCTDLSLRQCVKEKTRGKNILDLVLVYDKNLIFKITQFTPLAKSDHNILNVYLNVTKKIVKKQLKSYSYNKANYNKLLTNFRDKSIPQFKRRSENDVPWLNNKLKVLIKKRNNLFKRYKKNGQSYSKIKYTVARNNVIKQIRRAKCNYEANMIKRSKNNRKVFYAYVTKKIARNVPTK